MVAQRNRRPLQPATVEGYFAILRLLYERRENLAGERVRIVCRLHGVLRDLIAGGAPTNLTSDKAAALLRTTRPSPRRSEPS